MVQRVLLERDLAIAHLALDTHLVIGEIARQQNFVIAPEILVAALSLRHVKPVIPLIRLVMTTMPIVVFHPGQTAVATICLARRRVKEEKP